MLFPGARRSFSIIFGILIGIPLSLLFLDSDFFSELMWMPIFGRPFVAPFESTPENYVFLVVSDLIIASIVALTVWFLHKPRKK